MIDQSEARPTQEKERFSTLIGHFIVAVMLVCFSITLIQIGRRMVSGWDGSYLILVGSVVAIESMYTRRSMQGYPLLSPDWAVYRGTEWILLLVFIKAIQYLTYGFDQLWTDLAGWRTNFFENFFTAEYLFVVMVAFTIWVLSARFSDALAELADEGPVLQDDELDLGSRLYLLARQRLADLILFVGAGMVFLVALMRIDWQVTFISGSPPRGGIYNILAYFLLGLVLLSLTQFSILRRKWRRENIHFSGEVARGWALYGFLFLLAIGIIASLLPTDYSLGLLALLNTLIGFFMGVIRLLWSLMWLPYLLLLSLIAFLLGRENPEVQTPAAPEISELETTLPPSEDPWLELLKSLVFWLVFVGAILFSARYFLQEHSDLVDRVRRFSFFQSLNKVWAWVLAWLKRSNQRVMGSVRSQFRRWRLSPRSLPPAKPGRFLSLRRLNPRQQVIFFYQAMLRRGGESGAPRQPAQTPYEYAQSLQSGLPLDEDSLEAGEKIASLTGWFVEARYSQHEVTSEQASVARQVWQRIRRILRKRNE